jgi:hypothetical protein
VNRLEDLDLTPGPRSPDFPADCLVEDCLIYWTGRVEKQTAGVQIQLAQRVTVRHCSIYDLPRAGINIGDGSWGGHVIEFCNVFDTGKEAGDHGSFSPWGRDRFWRPDIQEVDAWVKAVPELPRLDAVQAVMLPNSRWRCDHGWDIDLDDGSSDHVITNNLCLRGGIKNREGFGRIVENNIPVGSVLHPHVWYAESRDVFRRNLVWREYQPALMPPPPWGHDLDFNLVHQDRAGFSPATQLLQQSGRDEHSVVAAARFMNPTRGDCRVRDDSPALMPGFVNFPMDQFGVRKPALKTLARTPVLAGRSSDTDPVTRDLRPRVWLGAEIRNVADSGEASALGLAGAAGVLVLDVPAGSVLSRSGVEKGDVILSLNGTRVADTEDLLRDAPALVPFQSLRLGVWRQQAERHLDVRP